jgi:Ca2+-binding RTX toxin-like protein
LLGGGSGQETFFAGSGNATVIGGTGADLYAFVNGEAGGSETIFGFDSSKGDQVTLQGYGPDEVRNDLKNATTSGGNTVITLSDNTSITFIGVTNLSNSNFI